MSTVTATRALIETRLNRDLTQLVRDQRADGRSWREIAKHISEQTGVPVSYETLRTWFGGAQ